MVKRIIGILNSHGLNIVFSFGTTYFLSKGMSSSGYGELAILMSFHSLLLVFSKSLNPGILKLINSNNVDESSHVVAQQLRFYGSIFQLIFGIILFAPLFIYFTESDLYYNYFVLIVIQSVGFNVEQYILQDLQSKGHFKKYAIVNTINRAIKLIGILLLVFSASMNLIWVLLVQIFSQYTCLLYSPFRIRFNEYFSIKNLLKTPVVKYSVGILLTEIVLVLGLKGQYFFAFSEFDNSEIGNFALAENLILFIGLVPQSILTIYAPIIQKTDNKSERTMMRFLWNFHLGYLMICVGGYFSIAYIIEFVFGSQYVQSVLIFKILIVGAFFTMCSSSYFPFFHKWGNSQIILYVEGTTSLLFVSSLLFFQFDSLTHVSILYALSRLYNFLACNLFFFKTQR